MAYIGKVLTSEHLGCTKVIMLGCEKESGDFYTTPKPRENFIYKGDLHINEKLKSMGFKELTSNEVETFFLQK